MSSIRTITRTTTRGLHTMTQKPVLIIGSGLGGLTLAHALQKHNIPFRIYERDGPERLQGYRVRIHGHGLSALKEALPGDVWEKFEHTCGINEVMAGGGISVVNARSAEVQGMNFFGGKGRPKAGGPPPWAQKDSGGEKAIKEGKEGPPAGKPVATGGPPKQDMVSLPADRGLFREALLYGLPRPAFGKAFVDYTVTPTGVTATFADGTTSEEGSLLVGCDGTNSRVARKLIGEAAKPFDFQLRMIYGKTYLTPEITEEILPGLRDGMRFIEDKERPDGQVTVYLEVMRFRPEVERDYIYWCLVADRSMYGLEDDALLQRRGTEAVELAKEMTREWHPQVKAMFAHAEPKSTSVLRMTTSRPNNLPVWDTNARVTVLGDAIHCMPPTGGNGANSALFDANELAKILAQSKIDVTTGAWSEETISKHETDIKAGVVTHLQRGYGMAIKVLGLKPVPELES